MRVVVAGVPGAGKTSIMKEVAMKTSHRIVNYGTVMLEQALAKNVVSDRDEIRKLPITLQKELQRDAAKKIGAMSDVIVDTHLTIKTPSGYFPGLPVWVLEELKPDLIVVVEAGAHEIMRRRKEDRTRKRDFESYEEIEEHLKANRMVAFACSVLTGAPVMVLQNHDGMLEQAVEKFMEAFK
ncbi:MAG: adenylate kinase [Euryarchaeota archaeon]|nr:adenylate kinase [Euryarchaeota archaeon]